MLDKTLSTEYNTHMKKNITPKNIFLVSLAVLFHDAIAHAMVIIAKILFMVASIVGSIPEIL